MSRAIVVAIAVFLLALINGALIFKEKRIPAQKSAEAIARIEDAMNDASYISSARQANLQAIGLDAAQARRAGARITELERDHAVKLRTWMQIYGDPDQLAQMLCTEGALPPRYGALFFFVQEGRTRIPVKLETMTELAVQQWAERVNQDLVREVYKAVDRVDGRKKDASIMALAAILLKKEQALLNAESPWGPRSWSWSEVRQKNPGIEERVIEYLAVMHLAAETALGEGDVCSE